MKMILISLMILLNLARMSECNNILYSNVLRVASSQWGTAVHSSNNTRVDFTFEMLPFDTTLTLNPQFTAPELWFYLRTSYLHSTYTAMVGVSKNGHNTHVEFAKFRTRNFWLGTRADLRTHIYHNVTDSEVIRDPPCTASFGMSNIHFAEGHVPACAFDFSPATISYLMMGCHDMELRHAGGNETHYTGFTLTRLADHHGYPSSFSSSLRNVRPCR
ncbi:uncharacterized protein LOC131930227 [Physella acuta]|uniref:uncharacterized protein LOC131930227 n=1 Tax=Physella acuta TaxID=109671 RepID=UPI0027DD5CE2|nr:uncharacterized protein LOC131930227 [Physella acuta]